MDGNLTLINRHAPEGKQEAVVSAVLTDDGYVYVYVQNESGEEDEYKLIPA